jgi:hypothetical protein
LNDPNDPWLARFSIPSVLGDFNRDGQLTVEDVQAMLAAMIDLNQFKTPRGLLAADLLAIGDFNHDNQLTNADLQMLLNALTSSATQSLSGVPEPESMLLMFCGVICILGFQTRRVLPSVTLGCTVPRTML